jgi:hypothetical protein
MIKDKGIEIRSDQRQMYGFQKATKGKNIMIRRDQSKGKCMMIRK